MSELRSKCCGDRIYYDYKEIDDFKPPRYIGLRHIAYCSKCHKPTQIKEKEEKK